MERGLIFMMILYCLIGLLSCCHNAEKEQRILPQITAVFPSADTLPENLLRMYIHFSKPMKTIGNLEKIKLIDEKGVEVVGAIFNNVYELWDNEQKQLTIIFDPARVKTGLEAHQERGRALQAGKQYDLVIGFLEDVEEKPLKEVFTKSFFITEEDRLPPNTNLWEFKIPKAESQSPLKIQFPAMLDRLSLLQSIQITDENNQPINGEIKIKTQETMWQFTPVKKWSPGNYILYIHNRLEDPAGNNLNGLFDHKRGNLKHEKEIEEINFKIK